MVRRVAENLTKCTVIVVSPHIHPVSCGGGQWSGRDTRRRVGFTNGDIGSSLLVEDPHTVYDRARHPIEGRALPAEGR